MHTTHAQIPTHSVRLGRGLATIVAVLTCPCHLPIVLPVVLSLLAGTAAGAWLSSNQELIWGLFAGLFALSVFIAVRGVLIRPITGGHGS